MLSVIAPAYNNAEEVEKLLASIKRSEKIGFPFEVLIVDDGSDDYAIRDSVSRYEFARYIRLDKNDGAAAARNRGAREAKFDLLFYVDSDVIVFPDTLSIVAGHFSDPAVQVFVGRLDMIPENNGFFPRYKAIMFNSWLPREGYSTVFSPAIGAIRKDAFFVSGGFDEAIKGATVEYVKFSYELRKKYMIQFFPDVVVRVKINSFRKALYTDFYSTMKWVTIFSRYKKFDNHCTSVSGGMGRLLGFLTLVLLPLCIIYRFYLAWAVLFSTYLYFNKSFFLLVAKETKSPLFLLRSITTHLILCIPTVFGGLTGLLLVAKTNMTDDAREAKRGS